MNPAHEALSRLLSGEDLSRQRTEDLFGTLMDGELSQTMIAALLVALAMKGEVVDEIAGAAAAMRRRVVKIPHHVHGTVDTCGTGGDGKGTFNISTAAALVAAAAGVPIAKHGNRSISSRSGSADVLAALGVAIEQPPAVAGRALAEIGIAFLFAPKLHPAMKEVMPVRQELGVRTIFNVLGPLTNPAGARRQVLGVYAPHLVEILAGVLQQLGAQHAMVVQGLDGLDELTTTGLSHVAELREGVITTYDVDPRDYDIPLSHPMDLAGGTPEDNAATLRRVLAGDPGPLADITVLNAGAAVYVGGLADDLAAGITAARRAIEEGLAAEKLQALVDFE